jgi:uncharacterized cupin superfamily protein
MIEKVKEAIDMKKKGDLQMLKSQMEETIKVHTYFKKIFIKVKDTR